MVRLLVLIAGLFGVLAVVTGSIALLMPDRYYYTSEYTPPGGWNFSTEGYASDPCGIMRQAQQGHINVVDLVPTSEEANWHRFIVGQYQIVLDALDCR